MGLHGLLHGSFTVIYLSIKLTGVIFELNYAIKHYAMKAFAGVEV
jgi:hypothetical protein